MRSGMATAKKAAAKTRKPTRKQIAEQKKRRRTTIIGFVLMILGIFMFAAAIFGKTGILGVKTANVLFGCFGLGAYVVPLLIVLAGWVTLLSRKLKVQMGKVLLTTAAVLMVFVVFHLFSDKKISEAVLDAGKSGYGGYISQSYAFGQETKASMGALGGILTYPLRTLLGTVGCWILTVALMIGSVFALGKLSMQDAAQKVTDSAVNTGKRLSQNVQTQRATRAEYREQRRSLRETQTQNYYDEPTFEAKNREFREETVSVGKAAEDKEIVLSALQKDEIEVGQIYDAPRRRLDRINLTKSKGLSEDEDEIEIEHFGAAQEEPFEIEENEEDIVPVEIVPLIRPVTVQEEETEEPEIAEENEDEEEEEEIVIVPRNQGIEKTEEVSFAPLTRGTPLQAQASASQQAGTPFGVPMISVKRELSKNPSVSDFDDNGDEDEPIIEGVSLSNVVPKAISPAKEVEYKYGEEASPVLDDVPLKEPYRFPPVTLLSRPKNSDPLKESQMESEQQKNVSLLEETLLSFGIEARVVNVAKGPAITRYELQPARGVKVSKITSLSDDIALNMAAAGGVRIEAPIPGKSAVGIEIANSSIATVTLREVLESREFKEHSSKLAVALGKDIAGTPVVADLARMPHLLIAGATGSGKSVCINSIIASILYKATPEEVKLIMIDPKVVELSVYNGIPHLLIPVVTDTKKAAGALGWAVQEMTDRYKKFEGAAVRDLKGYNRWAVKNGQEIMPQIVLIIDELADLMMVAQNDVETKICRLTQLARAAGIHLVIATQRPSVDVITGLIKANVPSRIAFAVASQVDSRTILGIGGAEKLLGRGDMLFDPSGASKAIRVQGAYIDDDEVTQLVEYVKDKSEVKYDESVIRALSASDEDKKGKDDEKSGDDDTDPLVMECVELALDAGQISASMIQRKYRVGYARAGRILDQMEKKGYISGFDGSKPRKVIITREQFYAMVGAEGEEVFEDPDEE